MTDCCEVDNANRGGKVKNAEPFGRPDYAPKMMRLLIKLTLCFLAIVLVFSTSPYTTAYSQDPEGATQTNEQSFAIDQGTFEETEDSNQGSWLEDAIVHNMEGLDLDLIEDSGADSQEHFDQELAEEVTSLDNDDGVKTLTVNYNHEKIYGQPDPQSLEEIRDSLQNELNNELINNGFNAGDANVSVADRSPGECVGTYSYLVNCDISQQAAEQITIASNCTLTINKRPVRIIPNAASKTVGDDDPQLTEQISWNPQDGNYEPIEYTLTREYGEEVGSYRINVILLNGTKNYNVIYGYLPVFFTINPAFEQTIIPPQPFDPFAPEPTAPAQIFGRSQDSFLSPIVYTEPDTDANSLMPSTNTNSDAGTSETQVTANDQSTTESNPNAISSNQTAQPISSAQTPTTVMAPIANEEIIYDQSWATFNLFLALLGLIIAIGVLINYFTQRRHESVGDFRNGNGKQGMKVIGQVVTWAQDHGRSKRRPQYTKKRLWPRVLAFVPAVIGLIFFYITEDFTLPLGFVDQWTLWQAAILTFVILLAVVGLTAVTDSKKYQEMQTRRKNRTNVDGG